MKEIIKNNVSIFNFGEREIRTILIDGEPWFVASDISSALDFRDNYNALRSVDECDKDTHIVSTLGGDQNVTIINEAGMYSLILKSRKEEAKVFKNWVTHDVLPSIRKTGSYAPEPKSDLVKLAEAFLISDKIRKEQEQLLIEQKPKVEAYETFLTTDDTVDIKSFANTTFKELKLGQKLMFKTLRNRNYITQKNLPFQRYLSQGLFKVKQVIYDYKGEKRIYPQVRVTPKGQEYLLRKLRNG